jgi:hypothetical protein
MAHVIECPSKQVQGSEYKPCTWKEGRKEGSTQIRREKVKLSMFADDMMTWKT